jgi:hydroxymethylpyrimidine/phosphomethylpyrimidine kinase
VRMLRGAMPNAPVTTPRVLSIAGSDSGGGAGIQADLKAFASCGVHGMTAITAVTWQNTVAVTGITPIPPEAILGQVRAVADDIGVDAVKIGMLGSAETVTAVRAALDLLGDVPVVLDPVMVAESGASLLDADARRALLDLLPAATVITPNLLEARALAAEAQAGNGETPVEVAAALGALGPGYVVVTGGHAEGAEVVDLFWDGEHAVDIPGPRYPGGSAHGSGCTHSSALAAHLALGLDPLEAAVAAKRVAAEAVRDALSDIGAGPGPVDALGIAARRRVTDSAAL